MRILSVAAALVLAPAAFAQTATTHIFPTPRVTDGSTHTVLETPATQNCPVGIETRRVSGGAVEQVHGKPARPHIGYNITLRALDARLIRQADVKLTGIAGGHVLPADSAHPGDVTESFTIAPGDTPKAELHSVVYTKQLTGVRWVEVDSLTYADGTVWRQKPGSICRVAPDLYLPVHG